MKAKACREEARSEKGAEQRWKQMARHLMSLTTSNEEDAEHTLSA